MPCWIHCACPLAPLIQCWLARPASRLAKFIPVKHLPLIRRQTPINIEIGGSGGKNSSQTLRHLLSLTCEVSAVTSSHLTLQQHNAIARRVALGRGGARAAPRRAATRCGGATAPAGLQRVTARCKAQPFQTLAAAVALQRTATRFATKSSEKRKATQCHHNKATVSLHSLKPIGSQSGHSRVTVGSQSGHRFLYDFATRRRKNNLILIKYTTAISKSQNHKETYDPIVTRL